MAKQTKKYLIKTKKKDEIVDLVLTAVPLALVIGVALLTTFKQIQWQEAASLLAIAVVALSIRNFREK